MKRTFDIKLSDFFGPAIDRNLLRHREPKLVIGHSEVSYYGRTGNEAILQEFDGHLGYLYCLDLWLQQRVQIPIHVDMRDLHVLYLIEGQDELELGQAQGKSICRLAPCRARYLYLPQDDYQLELPAGYSQLFGFYFRARIFRMGNDRPYDFLQPLLQAYHDHASSPVISRDFRIGQRTKLAIETLAHNLQPKQLSNEQFVLDKLIRLIELSKEKITEEEIKNHYELRIAEQVHQLVVCYVELEGQLADIRRLEDELGKTLATLNHIHKIYFGTTLRRLRDNLLIQRAVTLLQSGESPTACAYILNYNSPEAFYHFFKKKMGMSPLAYLRSEN